GPPHPAIPGVSPKPGAADWEGQQRAKRPRHLSCRGGSRKPRTVPTTSLDRRGGADGGFGSGQGGAVARCGGGSGSFPSLRPWKTFGSRARAGGGGRRSANVPGPHRAGSGRLGGPAGRRLAAARGRTGAGLRAVLVSPQWRWSAGLFCCFPSRSCSATAARRCWSTCDDVRKAYRWQGWASKNPEGREHCKREGFSQKMQEQKNEGCQASGFLEVNKSVLVVARDTGGITPSEGSAKIKET
uniref:Endoplasmic reticulum vesicle transporter C-terminal domain-containing protein n=1 Tax=Strigops habroptila TaxID=2489341 RepID=A0A672V5V0_STRHB